MLFLSSIISPCVVCVFARCRSDLSALAVLYAHDRYCRGLGRVLVLIIHITCMIVCMKYRKFRVKVVDAANEI